MKLLAVISSLLFATFFPMLSLAEETAPSKEEKAEIVCSWSKMNATEYKACQARRDQFNNLSEQEKRQQNREVAHEKVESNANDHFNPRIAAQKNAHQNSGQGAPAHR